MAEKNVILKDGADTLYPKTKAELVEGLPQPTSADNGKMLGVDNGAYALVEGSGSVAWGQITGAIADQTDLTNALGQYLPLTGGTMTGSIRLRSSGTQLTTPRGTALLQDFGHPMFGDINSELNLACSRQNLTLSSGGYPTAYVLHTGNTAANEPLAGTEADLTSLKLNGTTYKVPSGGGGGGSLYAHYISTSGASPNYACKFLVICDRSAAFTKAELASYLYNSDLTGNNKCVPAVGYVVDNNVEYSLAGIYGDDSGNLYLRYQTNTASSTRTFPANPYFNDTIVQIL